MSDPFTEIQQRVDLVDLVAQYLELKRSGRSFMARCPFHSEKTPSFTISREKGLWYCFGCHKGGNTFQFVKEIENLDDREALEFFSRRYGIKLERGKGGSRSKRDTLLQIHEEARSLFKESLHNTSAGQEALKYLGKRGLEEKTISEFGLGYAPRDWSRLTEHLIGKGFHRETLEESGLSFRSDKGNFIDRFRDRIMVPIENLSGQTVAFAGRTLSDDPQKYVNSPTTAIYQKGRELYGLSRARGEMARTGYVIVVEGYFGLLKPFQAGIQNIVAICGTAFTRDQIGLLERYTRNIYIAFDSDQAGIESAKRCALQLLQGNLDPRLILFPQGMDPDEFLEKKSAEEFRGLIQNSYHILDFIQKTAVEQQAEKKEGTGEGDERRALLDLFRPVMESLDDPLLRDLYSQRTAEKVKLRVEELLTYYKIKTRRTGTKDSSASGRGIPSESKPLSDVLLLESARIEEEVITGMLRDETHLKTGLVNLSPEDFTVPWARNLFALLAEKRTGEGILDADLSSESRQGALTSLMGELPVTSQSFNQALIRLKERRLRDRCNDLDAELRRSLEKGETDRSQTLLAELQALKRTPLRIIE